MKTPGLLLLGLTLIVSIHHAAAQGTAFTYQGRLNSGGAPANGIYDLQFTVYDAVSNGIAVSNPLTNSAAGVTNGLFIVTLDFGDGIFDGNSRWLEIAVSTNGANNFVTLAPRQQITPTPYAIMANSASNLLGNLSTTQLTGTFPANQLSGTIPSANLSGSYGSAVTFNNGADTFDGTFIGSFFGSTFTGGSFNGQFFGDGSGLFGLWRTTGNAGTTTNLNFLGTTDNQPLEVRVNNTRALRIEPDSRGPGYDTPNLIGGYFSNAVIQPGSAGNTIAGGGYSFGPNYVMSNSLANFIGSGSAHQIGPNVNDSVIGGGYYNTILSPRSVIAGGDGNLISTNAGFSAIGGGSGNIIQPDADHATIAGGFNNSIQTNAWDSTVSGGYGNAIQPYAEFSVIGGGNINTLGIGGAFSVIGGGNFNTNNSAYSFIGGGYTNLIEFNNWGAFIGAGAQNTIQTGAGYSAIGGGQNNTIQTNSSFTVISGGQLNTNSAANSIIGGGYQNNIQPGNAAVIGGGFQNTIQHDSYEATIAGGWTNNIDNNSYQATIGGGSFNVIEPFSYQSLVSGGQANVIHSSSFASTIGGGFANVIEPNSQYATVPGGLGNFAGGNGSFAAGSHAQATNDGSFVWADNSSFNFFSSSTSNQFLVRATGGVAFVTGGAGMTIDGQPILSSLNGGSLTNVNAATLNGLSSSAFAAASGSANYVQNQNASPQIASFNISGNGTVGGTMTASNYAGSASNLTDVIQSVSARGFAGATVPTNAIVFVGPLSSAMSLTSGQKVFISASAALGTTAASLSFDFGPGYTLNAGTTNFTDGINYLTPIATSAGGRQVYSTSQIFTAPSTGTYVFGVAVRVAGAVTLNNNDYMSVAVMTFK